MRKIGNLFELARQQLEKEKEEVTPLDVIDRAIEIRKKLDDEEDERRRKRNRRYYLKKKIKTQFKKRCVILN